MARVLMFFLLLAFTFASGGVHKLVHLQDQSEIQISSTHDVVKAGVEKCCDAANDETGIEKPRCLGDNCVSSIAGLAQPDDFSSVIRRYSAEALGNVDLNRFLRPPIA